MTWMNMANTSHHPHTNCFTNSVDLNKKWEKVTRGILALECVHFEGDEQFLKKKKIIGRLGSKQKLKMSNDRYSFASASHFRN